MATAKSTGESGAARREGFGAPRSLRWQLRLAAASLALLILVIGALAIYALRSSSALVDQLAEQRLARMHDAQDLVERTLLIEHQAHRLLLASSAEEVQAEFGHIVDQLRLLDDLVARLGMVDGDTSILALHQASQNFRNIANIVAQLREEALAADDAGQSGRPTVKPDKEMIERLAANLRQEGIAMLMAARHQSNRFSSEYRHTLQQLAEESKRNQYVLAGLLGGGLLLAWLVTHFLFGRWVLVRLQRVSDCLRHGATQDGSLQVPVAGHDEIGDMARAVESFLEDRRRLADANRALSEEKRRLDELLRRLAEAHGQLLQSEKLASVGQLAAGVAHEINNPISVVSSNMGALQRYSNQLLALLEIYEKHENLLPDAVRDQLADRKSEVDLAFLRQDVVELIVDSAKGLQRVKQIVQDLREFIQDDYATMQSASVEKCLETTLNVISSELADRIDVIREFGQLPDIECIPSQINQVFLNLLMNAAQAIKGRGVITIRTGYDEQHIWVDIADTGCGMPAELQEKIFDPFFTTKPVGTGTGMGLSMTYGIVKKHGGTITVTSQVGEGSTFRVTLPRIAARG